MAEAGAPRVGAWVPVLVEQMVNDTLVVTLSCGERRFTGVLLDCTKKYGRGRGRGGAVWGRRGWPGVPGSEAPRRPRSPFVRPAGTKRAGAGPSREAGRPGAPGAAGPAAENGEVRHGSPPRRGSGRRRPRRARGERVPAPRRPPCPAGAGLPLRPAPLPGPAAAPRPWPALPLHTPLRSEAAPRVSPGAPRGRPPSGCRVRGSGGFLSVCPPGFLLRCDPSPAAPTAGWVSSTGSGEAEPPDTEGAFPG